MDRDDRWIIRNFSQLIEQYSGQYIAVVHQRVVASGSSAKQVEQEAQRITGVTLPSVLRLPRREDSLRVV